MSKGVVALWLGLAALALLALTTPLETLFVPGVLLVLFEEEREPARLLVTSVAVSLSFWMAAFWLLDLLGIPYSHAVGWVTLATLGALAWLAGSGRAPQQELSARRADYLALGLILLVAMLRFRVLWIVEAPPGADMSMHGYVAALIQAAQGVPDSYRPLVPIEDFGALPVGFEFLTAVLVDASNLEIHRAAFLVGLFSHGLLLLASYALLRRSTGPMVAAMVAITYNFLTNDPAAFALWGGNPTVLASALFGVLLLLLMDIRRPRSAAVPAAGIVLAGVMATHTIVLVQGFYLLLLSLPVYYVLCGGFKRRILPVLMVAATGCGLMLPYLLTIDVGLVTPPVTAWIENWVRESPHSWHGGLSDFLWTIPQYMADRLGWRYLLLAVLFCAPLLWGRQVKRTRDTAALAGTILLAGVLLLLNTQYWLLPLSYLVYPERVVLLLTFPLAVLVALGLDKTLTTVRQPRRASVIGAALLAIVLVQAVRKNEKDFVGGHLEWATLTGNDARALAWIGAHTPPTAVIETNYGDGGVWIPAISGRAVTSPHVNVLYLDKLEPQAAPSYRFIGEKCVYQPCSQRPAVKTAARFGKARIYALRPEE